jgi:uncharacterized protein
MLASLDDGTQDRGPRDAAAARARLCVATREIKPVDDMIRFVVGPDRAVVPDLKRKLPGRGVWVTGRRDAIAGAVRGNAFRRGFKTDVTVSKNLPDLVAQLLERSVLDALAMAHKAGCIVAGFAKVEAAIASSEIAALIVAEEAGKDGRQKIAGAIKRRFGDRAEHIVTIVGFASAQLDLALGRPNVVHAALLAQRPSQTVLARWRVLERFRTVGPDPESNTEPLDTGAPRPGLE